MFKLVNIKKTLNSSNFIKYLIINIMLRFTNLSVLNMFLWKYLKNSIGVNRPYKKYIKCYMIGRYCIIYCFTMYTSQLRVMKLFSQLVIFFKVQYWKWQFNNSDKFSNLIIISLRYILRCISRLIDVSKY